MTIKEDAAGDLNVSAQRSFRQTVASKRAKSNVKVGNDQESGQEESASDEPFEKKSSLHNVTSQKQ